MSIVTTVYDALIAQFNTLYPNKTRLFNPYELKDNANLILKDAWGLKVGSAQRIELDYCNLALERNYTLVLTRSFATVNNKETDFDLITKGILEDQRLALNDLWELETISATQGNKLEITNIGGIDFMVSDEKKLIFIEIEFSITTSEKIV